MAGTKHLIRDEHGRHAILTLIGCLTLSGKVWQITVQPYTKKRSLSQNALLHTWFGLVAEETGNRVDEVKEAYRGMFLPQVVVDFGDREILIGTSTTRLSTEEFSAFLDCVYAHATQELGILLPLPDEIGRDSDGRAID
jgi:hypothetical protein